MAEEALPAPIAASAAAALPAGITPKTVTVGTAQFFDGTLARGSATITAPVNVVHLPTGTPLFSGAMTRPFVDGVATFDLCPTDQPGLNRVDWTYTLWVSIRGARVQPKPMDFLLAADGPDVLDLDALVEVPSSAGTPVAVNAITLPAGGVDGQVLGLVNGRLAWIDLTTYPDTSGSS